MIGRICTFQSLPYIVHIFFLVPSQMTDVDHERLWGLPVIEVFQQSWVPQNALWVLH